MRGEQNTKKGRERNLSVTGDQVRTAGVQLEQTYGRLHQQRPGTQILTNRPEGAHFNCDLSYVVVVISPFLPTDRPKNGQQQGSRARHRGTR